MGKHQHVDVSEDGIQEEKVLTLIKNKSGEIVIQAEEEITIKKDEIKGEILEHIYKENVSKNIVIK
jgi:hypothetical protein